MSLLVLNTTQQAQVLEVLFKSTSSSVAPLLLLESFILGVFCAYVPLASYVLWVNLKLTSVPRAPSIAVLWISLVAIITHWALSLRQFESTLSGSSLEIPLTFSDLLFVVTNARDRDAETLSAYKTIASSFFNYGVAWQAFLPLITETALLGFASALFAVIAYIGFWQSCSQRRSSFALFIPAMASLMYTFSFLHWIVSLPNFTLHAANAGGGPAIPTDFVFAISVTLLILLSFNAVMSDSIVLWRMCVVWDRARPAVIFAATVLVTTLALNIANIVVVAAGLRAGKFDDATVNSKDTEFITTYGGTTIGLAAAFISLASNLCATILVSVKYWLHRRQYSKYLRSSKIGRTLVERVMELLIDSGVAYAIIWTVYCISFFQQITSQSVLGPNVEGSLIVVTAVSHLDAAMAQITTIYPLIIFLLIALDKIHHDHSRGPRMARNDDWRRERINIEAVEAAEAVTMTFEIDVERSTMQIPGVMGKGAIGAGDKEKHSVMPVDV